MGTIFPLGLSDPRDCTPPSSTPSGRAVAASVLERSTRRILGETLSVLSSRAGPRVLSLQWEWLCLSLSSAPWRTLCQVSSHVLSPSVCAGEESHLDELLGSSAQSASSAGSARRRAQQDFGDLRRRQDRNPLWPSLSISLHLS